MIGRLRTHTSVSFYMQTDIKMTQIHRSVDGAPIALNIICPVTSSGTNQHFSNRI